MGQQLFAFTEVLSIVSFPKSSHCSWRINPICLSKINSRVVWLTRFTFSRIVVTAGILSPPLCKNPYKLIDSRTNRRAGFVVNEPRNPRIITNTYTA